MTVDQRSLLKKLMDLVPKKAFADEDASTLERMEIVTLDVARARIKKRLWVHSKK